MEESASSNCFLLCDVLGNLIVQASIGVSDNKSAMSSSTRRLQWSGNNTINAEMQQHDCKVNIMLQRHQVNVQIKVTGNADSAAFRVSDRSYPNAVRSRLGSLGIAIWIAIFGVSEAHQSAYRSLLVQRTEVY
ncbi:hypothetical protein Tco_0811163 [Tanacetum coccineum]